MPHFAVFSKSRPCYIGCVNLFSELRNQGTQTSRELISIYAWDKEKAVIELLRICLSQRLLALKENFMNIEQRPQLETVESGSTSGQPNFRPLELLKEAMSNKRKDDTANSPITIEFQDGEMQTSGASGEQSEQKSGKDSESTDTNKGGKEGGEQRGKQSQGKGDPSLSIQEIIDRHSTAENPGSDEEGEESETEEDVPGLDSEHEEECVGERDGDREGELISNSKKDAKTVEPEPVLTKDSEISVKPGRGPEIKNGPDLEFTPNEYSTPQGGQPQVLEFSNPFSGK